MLHCHVLSVSHWNFDTQDENSDTWTLYSCQQIIIRACLLLWIRIPLTAYFRHQQWQRLSKMEDYGSAPDTCVRFIFFTDVAWTRFIVPYQNTELIENKFRIFSLSYDWWVGLWKRNICLTSGWLEWLIGPKIDQSELDALVPVITQDVWVKKFCEHSLANPTVALLYGWTLKIPETDRILDTHSFIESVKICH